MPRPKGLAKTGGRTKGTRNKAPELRAMITEALENAGGVAYLERQANENPGPFLALLGRLLPREMHAEISGELTVRAEIRRELIDKLVVLMAPPPVALQEASQAAIDSETSNALVLSDRGNGRLAEGERAQAHTVRQKSDAHEL